MAVLSRGDRLQPELNLTLIAAQQHFLKFIKTIWVFASCSQSQDWGETWENELCPEKADHREEDGSCKGVFIIIGVAFGYQGWIFRKRRKESLQQCPGCVRGAQGTLSLQG